MFKVNNSKVVDKISTRSLKNSRTRNIVAVMAIILTAVMFTTLFTIGTSVIESIQMSTMRQVGTRAHGGFKFMTWQQYEKAAADPEVKEISYNINVGFAENPELKKTYTELRYTEEKAAEWSFNLPTTGALPQNRLDIATTTTVLDALGVPHEIGAVVPLEFTANGTFYSENFTLCGWWEDDIVMAVNEAFVSREYCEEVAPIWQDGETDRDMFAYSGSVNPSLYFSSSWNLAGQMADLKERCGFDDDVNEGVNWAYATEKVDVTTIALIIGMLALIMLSGYLIIYNIFYISVNGDIKFYGLLKTIGTTNRQLKRIVRRQALLLSLIGIPVGLAAGYGISALIVPLILGITNIEDNIMSISPVIFIGSGIFTLITVWISCIKPCNLVSRISPVEATRYTADVSVRKKRKRTHSVTPFSMAVGNIGRTRKKTAAVILSLSLSLILLDGTVTLVNGFDMDKYIQDSVASDFYITDTTVLSSYSQFQMFNSISPELREEISNLNGVTETGSVYMLEYEHPIDSGMADKAQSIYDEYGHLMPPHIRESSQLYIDEKRLPSHIYGVEGFAIDKMNIIDGDFDREKFMSGNYVIISVLSSVDTGNDAFYKPGDNVTLNVGDTSKEYEIMALGNISYTLGPQHGHGFDIFFTLPSTEFMSLTGETGALNIAFNVEPEKLSAIEEWVKTYCETVNTDLDYRSRQTYIDEFSNMRNSFLIVGSALSFILGLIGILNFINSIVTSIQSRRQELAVLQSIGMTGDQLKKMLVGEGMCYIIITALLVLTLGNLITYGIIQAVANQMWFFTYHFVITPIVISLAVLIILATVIPMICYMNMCRRSVVDRLRETES